MCDVDNQVSRHSFVHSQAAWLAGAAPRHHTAHQRSEQSNTGIYLPPSSILLSPDHNAKNLQTHKMFQEAAIDKWKVA